MAFSVSEIFQPTFFIHLLSVAEALQSKPLFLPFFFCAGNLPEPTSLLESISEEEVIDAAF